MGKHLVIVESPAKAKTISKILGPDFVVMPSVGHIRDLPQKERGVDVDDGFKVQYEIAPGKTKVVSDLKKAVKDADKIYLAPDPDREGEAIAWHLREVLAAAGKGKEFLRVQYNEITPRAVTYAIAHPGQIDMDRVNAQQARRVIDRLVGFDVSKRLWRRVRGARSAGRVQTVALRLVCEREDKIRAFRPEPYWVIGATLSKDQADAIPFDVKLARINGEKAEIHTEEMAKAVLADLEPRPMRVQSVRSRDVMKHALPPFITSSLQQAASSVLGYSPSRTMALAQRLYEGVDIGGGAPVGLITYMRTDAPAVANDAQDAALGFIGQTFGQGYAPEKPNFYKSRGNAQEAHEAIRPTDVFRTPESLAGKLDSPELRLYDLIWRRFVASQMAPARLAQRTVDVEAVPAQGQAYANPASYIFTATSTEVAFDGFMKVMKLDIRKSLRTADGRDGDEQDDDSDDVDVLPPLSDGEALRRLSWINERKETKPPARFSEASLVKALEENGVGRPSTYASIIETLHDREYVEKGRKPLVPTELGSEACGYLTHRFPILFEVDFTAKMEEDLDEVEEGKVDWRQILSEFYGNLRDWIKEPPADTAKLEQVFSEFAKISKWAEVVKRGRRTIDDEKFFLSIKEQYESGQKPITAPQLESLVKVLLRYDKQLPGIQDRMAALGFDTLVSESRRPDLPPEIDEKFDLLLSLDLSERQRIFVESVKQQKESGRTLSQKQLSAIDGVLIRMAPKIPNAEATLAKFGLSVAPAALEEDTESPALIEKLSKITEWKEPVKRGKRVFDDKEFAESVAAQFKRNGALSPRQRAAISKMLGRYKDQVGE